MFRVGAITVAVAALAVGVGQARTTDHQKSAQIPKTFVLPGDALFPEGMGYDRKNGDFFVGAIGGGAVLRGNVGSPNVKVFSAAGADGRTAALGARPDHKRVFVGSFGSGKIWIYSENSGKLIAVLDTGMPSSVLNDFSFLPDGTAFATDSANPFLWRITFSGGGKPKLDKFLDFTGTPFVYTPGFNADGIVTSPNGRYLIINQLNTGKLFRVDVTNKAVTQIDVGGFDLTNADGMDINGRSLYVVRNRNAQIVKVDLSQDFSAGAVDTITTSPAFLFPTAAVVVNADDAQGDEKGEHRSKGNDNDENDNNDGSKLLVLNGQLDKLGGGTPKLPFTITSINLP
jgi:Cu-Zn family superoxide dismutase